MNTPTEVTRIIEAVAGYYNVTPADLLSRNRQRHVAIARHVCTYLVRARTRLSLVEIGAFVGGRDSTTVLHGVRVVCLFMDLAGDVAAQVREIQDRLNGVTESAKA